MSGHHTRLNWCRQKRCLTKQLDKETRSWLFDSGSLTARLVKHCSGQFSVKLVSIKRATPTPDEKCALGLGPRSQSVIREVLLCCDEVPLVYARTIIPVSSLRGSLRGLALLGSRPLGAVLFADKLMHRKPVEITSLTAAHKCYGWTQSKGSEIVYGRRSVFILKGQELLVSEFFLPELFARN